ncbi:FecR domain-containing protein [Echinicola marina]|uniref:FecR family protein n=1 Tax=Echinicola marina TaxID=2859768 RepID=UPI001CF7023A|nr:FecR domain-containing protein [Echinicola marina]UCS95282.1 FecR domain-containing protein [Echinicola marina]
MNLNNVSDGIIFKVLAGEASREELDVFETWLNESPDNEEKLQLYKEFWQRKKGINRKTKELVWRKVVGAIGEVEHEERKLKKVNWSFVNMLKIVATLTLILCLSIVLFKYLEEEAVVFEDEAAISYIEKVTPNGQKLSLVLPDGTKVKLNANSKLRLPKDFEPDKREVYLEGEAFFDVKRDTLRPFLIHSEAVTTKVLGTSFNIRTNPEEATISIAVLTGKVEVNEAIENKKLMLVPSEMAVFDKNNKGLIKQSFDEHMVLGWKDGEIWFEDSSFAEVIKRLSAWYGVFFKVNSKIKISDRYTGGFDKQSLDNVLDGISYTFQFDYRIQGDTVHINKMHKK